MVRLALLFLAALCAFQAQAGYLGIETYLNAESTCTTSTKDTVIYFTTGLCYRSGANWVIYDCTGAGGSWTRRVHNDSSCTTQTGTATGTVDQCVAGTAKATKFICDATATALPTPGPSTGLINTYSSFAGGCTENPAPTLYIVSLKPLNQCWASDGIFFRIVQCDTQAATMVINNCTDITCTTCGQRSYGPGICTATTTSWSKQISVNCPPLAAGASSIKASLLMIALLAASMGVNLI
jgi:hypothetical protein